MELWKWIAGGLGLGAAGLVVKNRLDKTPRVGDIASVPISQLSIADQPAATPVINILEPFAGPGIGLVNVTISLSRLGDSNTSNRGIVGAGIPVFFNRSNINRLTRAGKQILP